MFQKIIEECFGIKKCVFLRRSQKSILAVDSADSTKAWADEQSLAFRVFKEQCYRPFVVYPYLLDEHTRGQTIPD